MLAPGALVELAVKRGVKVLAITDHDTTDAWSPAREAAEDRLELWSAIEINCSEPAPSTPIEPQSDAQFVRADGTVSPGYEVHVLGYFIEPYHPALQVALAKLREARQGRIGRMVANLNRLGQAIALEDVQAFAHGPSLGRPHLARAMVHKGLATDLNEAFDRWLALGRPAYEPRHSLRPKEAIAVITEAGGLPVLAHPGLIGTYEFLEGYVDAGLRGLEVYYPQHERAQVNELKRLARRYGLLATGGSDYHGPGRSELGSVQLPDRALEALRTAGGR